MGNHPTQDTTGNKTAFVLCTFHWLAQKSLVMKACKTFDEGVRIVQAQMAKCKIQKVPVQCSIHHCTRLGMLAG